MKKVRVFIGSSITEFAGMRSRLTGFIGRINNRLIDSGYYIEPYVCEETRSNMKQLGSQHQHNEYIRNSADIALFLFHTKAGMYTMEELEVAFSENSVSGRPDIQVYFMSEGDTPCDSEGIRGCIARLEGDYGLGYKVFNELGTVEYELLQYISRLLGLGEVTKDGDHAFVGDMGFSLDKQ